MFKKFVIGFLSLNIFMVISCHALAAKTKFYRFSPHGGKPLSYVLGTCHKVPLKYVTFWDKVRPYWKSNDTIYFEVIKTESLANYDLESLEKMGFFRQSNSPGIDSLPELLQQEMRYLAERGLEKYCKIKGIKNEKALAGKLSMHALLSICQLIYFGTQFEMMDHDLEDLSMDSGKKVKGLETYESRKQAGAFTGPADPGSYIETVQCISILLQEITLRKGDAKDTAKAQALKKEITEWVEANEKISDTPETRQKSAYEYYIREITFRKHLEKEKEMRQSIIAAGYLQADDFLEKHKNCGYEALHTRNKMWFDTMMAEGGFFVVGDNHLPGLVDLATQNKVKVDVMLSDGEWIPSNSISSLISGESNPYAHLRGLPADMLYKALRVLRYE